AGIALFLVLRGFNLYGDPRPWVKPKPNPPTVQTQQPSGQASQAAPSAAPRRPQAPAWISFLNTTKYPASLLFLLMTLGPMFLVFPFFDGPGGRALGVVTPVGRVPFSYFMLHIPLIHLAAFLVSFMRSGSVSPWLFLNHPVMIPPSPEGCVWSLGLLSLVWAVVVVALFLPCRWFA